MPKESRRKVDETAGDASITWKSAVNEASVDSIFFWRPQDPWGLFSQWYTCPFKDPESGRTFQCNEQYMMYHKALAFKDIETAEKILASSDPRTHKDLGRKVRNFVGHEWDKVKYDIVVKANLLKFEQGTAHTDDKFVHPPNGMVHGRDQDISMREILLSTIERELVEASPMDRIWGIGYSPKNAADAARVKWGKNLLGKALMDVRGQLRRNDGTLQEGDSANSEIEAAAGLK